MKSAIRYLEVEKDLRKSIIEGEFKDGEILPSENDLCSQYGISRMTARKALNNLEMVSMGSDNRPRIAETFQH